MSGERPLARLIGDREPSSWYKYFSFWRSTLDTVLHAVVSRSITVTDFIDLIIPSFNAEDGYDIRQRDRSIDRNHQCCNSPPISVCLLLGCSSAYWHIRFRSMSVSVFRGVDVDRDDVAETGVCNGPIDMG